MANRIIIMAIKPEWAKQLYGGRKNVEFRKSSPPVGSIVFLYESAPVKAVTGCFMVSAVLYAAASYVWGVARKLESNWKVGTVKREDLFRYAGGANGRCCAILTKLPVRFQESERVRLEAFAVRPPQSWKTINERRKNENLLEIKLLNTLKTAISIEVPHA